MRSAALKNNDITPGKIRPVRSASRNVRTKLEPNSNVHSSKSRMLPDHGLDCIAAVHPYEDENRCVTRIHGKWAFSILSQLQHGPTQLIRLRSMLPQASRKKLTQYLRKLEKAGLIVVVDRGGRVPQAEYVLSEPLGTAAVHLMNAMAQPTERHQRSRA